MDFVIKTNATFKSIVSERSRADSVTFRVVGLGAANASDNGIVFFYFDGNWVQVRHLRTLD